jgi:nitrogen fixation protein NifU and related proteins
VSDAFYQKNLMDHFKNPRNKREVSNANFSSNLNNPSCGDLVSMTGLIRNGIVEEVGFSGTGCVISQATASMLTEMCTGKTVEEVLRITKDEIVKMLGVELGPNRLRCALLSLEALQSGVKNYGKH